MKKQDQINILLSKVYNKKDLAIELSKATNLKPISIYMNWLCNRFKSVPKKYHDLVLEILNDTIENQRNKK